MAKIIDFIIFRVLIFIISFIICSLFLNNLWLSLGVSFIATVLVGLITKIIKGKFSAKYCNVDNFTKHCVINGPNYVYSLLAKIFYAEIIIEKTDNYLLLNRNGKDEMVISALKFGNISPDEILKYYNLAQKKNSNHIYIISRGIDRKSISLSNNLTSIKFSYISCRNLYKIAKAQNLLPDVKVKKTGARASLKTIIGVAFAKNNIKHYMFTCIILVLMSFITPLRYYYLSVALVAFILAMCCVFNVGASYTKTGLFDKRKLQKKDFHQDEETTTVDKPQ